MTYPQQPGQPYPPAPPVGGWPTPPVPKKRRTLLHWVCYPATGLIALGIGLAAGTGAKTATTNTAARPAATVTVATTVTAPAPVVHTTAPAAKPTPTKPPPPPKPTIDDGYQVTIPGDVPAGRYDAHSTSDQCYWEIDRTASSDIVDNDLGKLGHLVVTLKSGETFSSHDCGVWTKE